MNNIPQNNPQAKQATWTQAQTSFPTTPPGLENEAVAAWKKSSRLRTASSPIYDNFAPSVSANNSHQNPQIPQNPQIKNNWNNLGSPWANSNPPAFWNPDANPNQIIRPKSGQNNILSDDIDFYPAKTQRSMSFSVGTTLQPDVNDEYSKISEFKHRVSKLPIPHLANLAADEELFDITKPRNRSKSSSAIYNLISNNDEYLEDPSPSPFVPQIIAKDIWNSTDAVNDRMPSSLYHRRASTQPNSALLWDAPNHQDPEFQNGDPMLNNEQFERYRHQRRFSHAPSILNDYSQRSPLNRNPLESTNEQSYDNSIRRHSVGPSHLDNKNISSKQFVNNMDRLNINDERPTNGAVLAEINDYFDNSNTRARAWAAAGKNLQSQTNSAISFDTETITANAAVSPSSYQWPLYVVEFKAGRTDFFFIPEESGNIIIKKGDIVIVEADRGKDLGKVTQINITDVAQLLVFQKQQAEVLPEAHSLNKQLIPKRIYRIAQPAEISLLFSKNQDEAKAMSVCQARSRQKNLPMEIVDAEYQWDRRKLTFYFVSIQRIDFRELVRELFKIYKTRIWMCAVNISKTKQLN